MKILEKCYCSRRWLRNWLLKWLPLFQITCKMISMDLIIQQVIDFNPNATQQNNFTENLGCVGDTIIFFIYKEAK